jgi:hypothetical protein
VLDHFREEDYVEPPVRGRVIHSKVPRERVDPVLPETGEAAIFDVRDAGMILLPQPRAQVSELAASDLKNVDPMIWCRLGESLQHGEVSSSIARVVQWLLLPLHPGHHVNELTFE